MRLWITEVCPGAVRHVLTKITPELHEDRPKGPPGGGGRSNAAVKQRPPPQAMASIARRIAIAVYSVTGDAPAHGPTARAFAPAFRRLMRNYGYIPPYDQYKLDQVFGPSKDPPPAPFSRRPDTPFKVLRG